MGQRAERARHQREIQCPVSRNRFTYHRRASTIGRIRTAASASCLKHIADSTGDHPNIARVFDAGITGRGRPFFVMELVAGEPITGYCDRQQLSVARRLELFLQVCEAVRHAHLKGIIHRGLKPSNILVTETDGKPVPR